VINLYLLNLEKINKQIEMFCGEVLEECKGLLRFNFESQSHLCRACTKATQKFSVSPVNTLLSTFITVDLDMMIRNNIYFIFI
jgi:hypothetical protein